MKNTFRRLINPFSALAWRDYLLQKFCILPAEQISFHRNKIHRPFYDRRLSKKQKLNFLIDCYQSSLVLFQKNALLNILSNRGEEVLKFPSKHFESYRVILGADPQFCREGFFTLEFFDKTGKVITVAFSINLYDKEPKLFIGSIQGTNIDSLNRIRNATHEMFGLQPRIFLIHLLKILANHLNIKNIEAISDSNHVYNSLRYRRRHQKKFQKYNIFWEQIAQLSENGNFNIDTEIRRKSIEEYPSKKRSEYRKRFTLLDDIEEQFSQFLTTFLK